MKNTKKRRKWSISVRLKKLFASLNLNFKVKNNRDGEMMEDSNIDKKPLIFKNFNTLLPDTSEDEIKKVYLATLDWAFKNDSIKNLAITGTYGSGKSSILKTYWGKSNRKDVLEISAATFTIEKELIGKSEVLDEHKDEDGKTIANLENVLEQNIMQQMFYKVKPKEIPLSRFNRIKKGNNWLMFFDVTLFLLTFLIVYHTFKLDWLSNTFEDFFKGTFTNIKPLLIGIIITVFTIVRVVHLIKGFRLSKLGIGKTTIELSTNSNHTVFNKYLDEIIYFFSQTEFNIVVFEDLDRFKNLEIFERLRGLNHLLNQSDELVGRNIVFVYALRDDIFSKADKFQEVQNRTKFFDFIIPTVKIMHSTNSESILLEKLDDYIKNGEDGNNDGLTPKVLTDTSLFINDMRILKNICNEYIIYRSALKQSGIIQDKLFSMIVYKNI